MNEIRAVPESGAPSVIECSPTALEEIRAYVFDGFTRLSRGGVEVGGALFGARTPAGLRVESMRPVPCQYAYGPSYVLSDKDRSGLEEVLEAAKTDPELRGLEPAGLFVSHSRSEQLALTESDRELMRAYFPEEWQAALLLRPERTGDAIAAFFLKQPGGEFAPEAEFRVAPTALPDRMVAPTVTVDRPKPAAVIEPAAAPVEEAQPAPRPRRGRRWAWLLAWCVSVAACVVAAWFYQRPVAAEPLRLKATEEGGILLVEWNQASRIAAEGDRATLEVEDGTHSASYRLDGGNLRRGVYLVAAKTGDVKIRLTVYDRHGGVAGEEHARYLGPPPSNAAEQDLAAARAEVDRLSRENAQLRGDLKVAESRAAAQAKRVDSLEGVVRIQRQRLDVAEKRPGR